MKQGLLKTPEDEMMTNNVRTNIRHKTANAQTKKNCNRGATLEWSAEKKLLRGLNQFYLHQTSPFNFDAAPNYKHMFGLHNGPHL